MIRKAEKQDLKEINELLARQRLNLMTEAHLEDQCLVGDIDGKIRGVIWAGVTNSRFMACVDYFAVDSNYMGLGFRLARTGLKILNELGVKKLFTFVEDQKDRDLALRINERFGLKRENSLYFLLTGEIKEMVESWGNQRHSRKSLN